MHCEIVLKFFPLTLHLSPHRPCLSLSLSLSTSHTKTIERNYFIVIKSHFLLSVTRLPTCIKASPFCNIVCAAAIIMLWTGKYTIVVHIIIKLSAIKFMNICEIFINLIVKQTCNEEVVIAVQYEHSRQFVTHSWIEFVQKSPKEA